VIERLARRSAVNPWRVIGLWIATVILAGAAAAFLMGELTTEGYPTNNPESQRADAALARAFPPDPNAIITDIVVVRGETGPPNSAFVARLRAELRRTRAVGGMQAPLPSRDGRAVAIPIFITETDLAGDVVDVVKRSDRAPDFVVAVTGDQTLDNDFNELSQSDLKEGELQFGAPAALVVLLLVFGALVAGLIPLLVALVSIAVAIGFVALFSQAFAISVFFINMLTGMGLALGIDYSLFILSRYREERAEGFEQHDAIGGAGATASRAVFFSGTAFVVAMLGMLIVPNNIMRSLALGAILVGIVSVVAALTLLPAVMGLLGDRINRGRVPLVGRAAVERTNPEGRFWHAIVERVLKRPGLSAAVSIGLLLALASPVLGLEIGTNGVSSLPDRLESKRGFIELQRSFPEVTTDPVEIVVAEGYGGNAQRALEQLRARLADDARLGSGEVEVAPDRNAAVLRVPVKGDSASSEAVEAVRELRADVIPEAFGGTNATVYVTGDTAANVDYFDSVIDPAPIVLAFVIVLTLVLLTIVFRSALIAVEGVFLNLLSVGAAYGLLVLVFQHGIGADLLGFQQVDSIEAWIPLFLFSVLFGLSMDYQVFLLSRIKERYDRSGDTREAVVSGVSSTARIITGAALIVIVVFLGFAMGDLVMFQQMGFGVAVALLIDATVIRSVVLPSLMVLVDRWNWYLPGWLQWLPRVGVGH
jgi:putative drug exporter of the RND superfamily